MSVELMNECKKKLQNTVNKYDKMNELFNSNALEKSLIETVKCESTIK